MWREFVTAKYNIIASLPREDYPPANIAAMIKQSEGISKNYPQFNQDLKITVDLNKFKNDTIKADGLFRFCFYFPESVEKGTSLRIWRNVDSDGTDSYTQYTSPLTIDLVRNYRNVNILKTFQGNITEVNVQNYITDELPQELKAILNTDVEIKTSPYSSHIDSFDDLDHKDYFVPLKNILKTLVSYPHFVTEDHRRNESLDKI